DLQQDAIWKAVLAARIWLDGHGGNAKRRPAVETLYKQAMWAYIWTTYTNRRDTATPMRTKRKHSAASATSTASTSAG
ncbi:MAG: hypothetical protein ACRELX_17720, partial [Longimicrobiales bacterium]